MSAGPSEYCAHRGMYWYWYFFVLLLYTAGGGCLFFLYCISLAIVKKKCSHSKKKEVYESTNTIYLLQELCLGGDLFDRLDEQPDIHYTEVQCAKLVKQMVSSVRYLHSKRISHRDLKLENFLFSTSSPDSELKMIDFGLSKHFDLGEMHHEQVGTPYTSAPEILKGSYDEKSDIWSLGVITYLLLRYVNFFGKKVVDFAG